MADPTIEATDEAKREKEFDIVVNLEPYTVAGNPLHGHLPQSREEAPRGQLGAGSVSRRQKGRHRLQCQGNW
jgi:hypothetical protein